MSINISAVQLTERNTKVVKDNKKMVNFQYEKGQYATTFLPAFFEIGDIALIAGRVETEQNGEYTNKKINFPIAEKIWLDDGSKTQVQNNTADLFGGTEVDISDDALPF